MSLNQEQLKAFANMERYFSDTHDFLYKEHSKAAKARDGLFCKLFESQIAAHDQAWCQWTFFLQDLKIPIDLSRSWRNPVQKKTVVDENTKKGEP